MELHVAEVALGAQLLFNLVLEQADGFGEHEVGPQLLGIERLDAVGTNASTGVGADIGAGAGVRVGGAHLCILHVANSKHVTSVTQQRRVDLRGLLPVRSPRGWCPAIPRARPGPPNAQHVPAVMAIAGAKLAPASTSAPQR